MIYSDTNIDTIQHKYKLLYKEISTYIGIDAISEID